jgi:hypothetical protein
VHRLYCYLAAVISIITLPTTAFAEAPATAAMQVRPFTPAANHAGFYVALPAVDTDRLIERISAQRASLTQREREVIQYLEDHQLGAKDVLITVIMPGGLIYAAVRKGNLQQAQAELDQINAAMDELSRDLVAMQAVAGDLTMAQLQ